MPLSLIFALGVGVAATVMVVIYRGLLAGIIPRLPLEMLVLAFPLAALLGTLFVKWRYPAAKFTALAAYFIAVLVLTFFSTLWALGPLEF